MTRNELDRYYDKKVVEKDGVKLNGNLTWFETV